MSYLLIVESPAKAKTIKKYLGKDYKVVASMGHVRDLPKSQIGIDIEHDFAPKYIPIRGKGDIIKNLKKEAKGAKKVYLATDPDREGEAISWHLANLLNIDEHDPVRVTFNEITKSAVKAGVKQPRVIDLDLVDAQQARRILDRLVGYEISPFLWRKVKKGISAGRVQSVATRLIVDREEEINAFKPQEYWTIDAITEKHGVRTPILSKFYGDENRKLDLKNAERTGEIVAQLKDADYTVKSVKKGVKRRRPFPPFITSTLQQDASRKLGFASKRTMQIAQELYEGVEIQGHGLVGLITYMRTDSLRISNEAIEDVRGYIRQKYGENYCPSKPRVYRSKNSAQDAHEAIRPTSIGFDPESIKKNLSRDQYRLYKLIWDRFVASQMEAQVLDTVSADILAKNSESGQGYLFRTSGYTVRFAGFTALYEESRDEKDEETAPKTLPELAAGDILSLIELKPEQHFTQPPARFNEATLIKALEENGIGRPSTYAPTIATILNREYVVKDGKSFKPTQLGIVTTKLMKELFSDIVSVEFTAKMERQLDEIEEGKKDWVTTVREFYEPFEASMKSAEEKLAGEYIKIPDEETDEICEYCGRHMVIKSGKYGKFMACPGYPECKNTKPIVVDTGAKCPKCGGRILQKYSKNNNKYYGCENNPTCDFMTWYEPTKENCPICGSVLLKKTGWKKIKLCSKEGCAYNSQPQPVKDDSTADSEAKNNG